MFSDLEGLCGKYETGRAERKGGIIHRKESSWFGLALLSCSCVNEPKKHKEKSKGLWRQVGRGRNPTSTTSCLCSLPQVTQPLQASAASSLK